MDEKQLREKITVNAKQFRMSSKNKNLLLKGKELEQSLKYLEKEHIQFMLLKEVELIQESVSHQNRKKFVRNLFFVICILGVGSWIFMNEQKSIVEKIDTFTKQKNLFQENQNLEDDEPNEYLDKIIEESLVENTSENNNSNTEDNSTARKENIKNFLNIINKNSTN